MPTLTLTEVLGEPRRWSGQQGGQFDGYRVKDDTGTVYEINVKAGNPPPKLGPDEFDITPPKEGTSFPPKIKRQFGGGGGGPRGRSPEDTKAIQRQHSQEMAIRTLAGMGLLNANADAVKGALKVWTDWFEADIQGGPQAPHTPSQSPSNGQPQEATSNQKRALTTALNRLGIDNPVQAKIVHAVAGKPPSKAGVGSLLDVVLDDSLGEREKVDNLAVMANVELGGGDAPADTRDLPGEDIPF